MPRITQINATGFNHWILGSADLAEPMAMPTELPYVFSLPDEDGHVPFPDVSLASRYQKWPAEAGKRYATPDMRGNLTQQNAGRAAVALRSIGG